MSFDQILKELKNKVYHPIYFLTGEETLLHRCDQRPD